jgi:adenylate cyclase
MERKLAAILYADVAGYSRMVGVDEDGTHYLLKTRLEAISEAVVANQGRVCHFAGDAVLAEFASITAALRCAVGLQRSFANLNESLPEGRKLRFRMGVNLGEVIVDGGDIYGNGVNVAARLEALAEPGGICISGRVFEQVEGKLKVGFACIGPQKVKNIDKAINVYRVLLNPNDSGKLIGTARPVRWSWKRSAVAAAIVVVIASVGALAWLGLSQPALEPAQSDPAGLPLLDEPVVAVLPFANTSPDPEQDYVAQAITEDLAGALGRFPEFGVVASESLAGFDNPETTPRDIRRKLGVSYLITGSVRRDGDAVHLLVKLIDTESGLQLWSERYHRPMGELWEVRDEIVGMVAGEAAVKLGRIESERVFDKATPDLESYGLYIRGLALIARETREDNIGARALFRQAIEQDPHFALAYIGLARTHYREMTRGWSQFMSHNVAETERLVRHALNLEPSLPEGFELLGWVKLVRGEYEQAEVALRKALSLNPYSLGTLQALGNVLTFLGDAEGAIQTMEKSVALGAQPSSRSVSVVGLAYVLSGDPKAAIHFLETYARDRKDHFYYATLAIAHAELGNKVYAAEAARQTRHAWPFFKAEEFVRQFRDPHHQQRIAEGLRKAGLV